IGQRILTRADGATIAYCVDSGGTSPGVMFCCGFRSDMGGTKAGALAAHCRARDQPYLRFDYSGHGASSGEFRTGTIGRWLEDTLAVLDRVTQGPQRSEEHTSELQSQSNLVCRLLLEKKKNTSTAV